MPATERNATAYQNVVEMSTQREQFHTLRYAYVKLHRAVLEVEKQLREMEEYDSEREEHLTNVREDAMVQRSACWERIQKLDSEIDTEVHRLNNGVYNE